jgi:hypothetical protein
MLSKKLLSTCQTAAAGGGGDIQFVGSAKLELSASQSSSTQPYISFPSDAISGVQSGDLLLVMCADDLSNNTPDDPGNGWTQFDHRFSFSGSSAMYGVHKTATSSDTSFSVDTVYGSSIACPSAIMLAFRNASFDEAADSSGGDRDDPPSVSTSAGDATVIVLYYQDDDTRASITNVPSAYTEAANAFSFATSSTSSGVIAWYNLSPSNPEDVDDLFGAAGDMAAQTIVLNNT